MGLMDVAVAIYLGAYMGILAILCVIGYFMNYRGKEDVEVEEDATT